REGRRQGHGLLQDDRDRDREQAEHAEQGEEQVRAGPAPAALSAPYFGQATDAADSPPTVCPPLAPVSASFFVDSARRGRATSRFKLASTCRAESFLGDWVLLWVP